MISIKIDVTKISKERLYKGKKGTYMSAVLIPTPDSEYGDYMIVESITFAEKQEGKRGTILGNAKIIKKNDLPKSEDLDMPEEKETDDFPF